MAELQDETALFYNASSKLTRASTPLEQLEAVSDYARESGASSGVLFYFEFDDDYRTEEVVAEWVTGTVIPFEVGTRFRLPQMSNWHTLPAGPILNHDLRTAGHLSPITREIDLDHHIYASVILRLFSRGRWVGAILFGWNEAREFDERDQRIYTVLQQLAAPVVDSVRLFEQTQKRAVELEVAKNEMDILYAISRQLVRATTPSEILEAVSTYARAQDARYARLSYFVDFQPYWLEIVAAWALEGDGPTPVGTIIDITNRRLPQYSMSQPHRPTFISDLQGSDLPAPPAKKHAASFNVRSVVQLPMHVNGRWIGILTFDWSELQHFEERDERIYAALQQQVSPVIDSLRLLDQSRSRTLELEQANQEINLLYRTSEIINSANTYKEVVEAVAQFDPDADTVTLMLWENLDWKASSYLEVMVVIDRAGKTPIKVGDRLPTENFPVANVMLGERVWIFEDARADSRVDPMTAQTWELLNIRAFMGPALYIQHRWIGGITFHSSQPRQYSEREARLFAGVGDLVIAAIERIRAREETDAARKRAEAFAEQAQQLAVLEERNRLARELHDSVSQALYGIVLGAQTARTFLDRDPRQAVEPLDYVLALSEAGLAEMRALIFELRPETLEKEGLIEALSKQVMMLQARHGLEVKTMFSPEPDIAIQLKEGMYWIAREALHNIVKHANASIIELCVTCTPDLLTLSIADNGVGFDIDADFSGHLGLKSMSERALKIGGALHIRSGSGMGTNIQLQLPLISV